MKTKNYINLSKLFIVALLLVSSFSTIHAKKDAAKKTPYGTLTGFIEPYNGKGDDQTKYCEAGTFITKKVAKVRVHVLGKNYLTGGFLGETWNQRLNDTGVGDNLRLTHKRNMKVTFYGTHDIVHTKGYHVYTSTIHHK